MNAVWILVLAAGVNSTLGNLLLKKSSMLHANDGYLANIFNYWFMGGMAFYVVNVILFARALAYLPVSAAYPVLAGSGFLLLSLASSWVFYEHLNLTQYAGIVVVLTGILMISLGGAR